jgi:hypothetical protein
MNKSRKFAALITLAIFFITFCNTVFAQEVDPEDPHGLYIEKPKPIIVGIVGGAAFEQIDGDNYAGYHKVAANIGGIGYIRIYRHVYFSFEGLYSQKGAKSDIVRYSTLDSTTVALKYSVNLNYVEIPLMINYFDSRRSHIGVGFSFSRLLNSSENLVTYPVRNINLDNYPFKNTGYDFVAGADLHLWKGLFMDVRFQYSLVPLRDVSPPGFSRSQTQYSNLWLLRAKYLFF